MLLPLEVILISKKEDHKWNSVCPSGSRNDKLVLILLIKFIIVYMKPSVIDVRRLGFEFIPK